MTHRLTEPMSKLGFNMMALASYHSYDKGIEAIKNTVSSVVENNYVYAGVNDTSENRLKVYLKVLRFHQLKFFHFPNLIQITIK